MIPILTTIQILTNKGAAMADNQREVRFNATAPIELRAADGDAGEIRVEGYAAVFEEVTEIGPQSGWGWREKIAPGAFTTTLERGDDVSFLINHRDLPLARTSSGTLTLTQDARGLKVESVLDGSDPDVQRILPKMKRGDLTKMSFAFRAKVEKWDESGDVPERTLIELDLFDVSIVTDPAYEGTEIGLRSREAAQKMSDATGVESIEIRKRKMKMRLRLAGAT
jgi:uncharacterized protein